MVASDKTGSRGASGARSQVRRMGVLMAGEANTCQFDAHRGRKTRSSLGESRVVSNPHELTAIGRNHNQKMAL